MHIIYDYLDWNSSDPPPVAAEAGPADFVPTFPEREQQQASKAWWRRAVERIRGGAQAGEASTPTGPQDGPLGPPVEADEAKPRYQDASNRGVEDASSAESPGVDADVPSDASEGQQDEEPEDVRNGAE